VTIDVEDWFQVENFKPWIPSSTWSFRPLRVERNTHRLLDLLDSCRPEPGPHDAGAEGLKATFFVLGWIARRLPNLVQTIRNRGHEVASHGFAHTRCPEQSPGDLKQDLTDSRKLLEDLLGEAISGYRAPSFSINPRVLGAVQECGYRYDSSYNSFDMHGRYGSVDLAGNERKGIAVEVMPDFYELPISNLRFGRWVVPLGGGGYFRLIPFCLFRRGVRLILNRQQTYLFYVHPWEIDPEQPRVEGASLGYRIRHYTNLGRGYLKLEAFLAAFARSRFSTCRGYLDHITGEGSSCRSSGARRSGN